MGRRCVVCDHEETESDRLRTDGMCVATMPCGLRFAALALRTAHGTDTRESLALDARAQHLVALTPGVTRTWSQFLSAVSVATGGAWRVGMTR
jgi:hypothetical protein